MPYPQAEKTCKTCIYFVPNNEYTGECYLRPPHVIVLGNKATSIYPQVHPQSFCGDGCWKKFSDITGGIELYHDRDSQYSWFEEREIKKREEETCT